VAVSHGVVLGGSAWALWPVDNLRQTVRPLA